MTRLLESVYFWLAVVAAALALGVGVSVWQWEWLRSGPDAPESNSATIRNLGLIVGGVIALAFAVWRGLIAQRQSETARRQAETAQQAFLNDRYQQGAELLRSDNALTRLDGVYDLKRLAEEYPSEYHTHVMRLISVYQPDADDGDFPRVSERDGG